MITSNILNYFQQSERNQEERRLMTLPKACLIKTNNRAFEGATSLDFDKSFVLAEIGLAINVCLPGWFNLEQLFLVVGLSPPF